ncbi:MAG: hypothetical protein HW389_3527 [Bacteroidetes bacterium]|nr:hypothetical protein [Bacteroidota bacterium]
MMALLQSSLFNQAIARIERAQRDDYYSFLAGQVAGTMSRETTIREIM